MRSIDNYIKQKQKNDKELKLIPFSNFIDDKAKLLTLSYFDEWVEVEKLNKKEIKRL